MEKAQVNPLVYIIIVCVFVWRGFLPASARLLEVGPGHPFSSINEAVRKAAPHDEVRIFGGKTYREHVVINKPLTIIGKGWPVVDGCFKTHVIEVRASHVTISGLKVMHSNRSSRLDYAGIFAQNVSYVRIMNNILKDNMFSIMLQQTNYCAVEHNQVESNITENATMGSGIHCWKGYGLRVTDNKVGHHRDGIYLEFCEHSDIARNTINGCERYGLHFMFSHYSTYMHNVFRHNRAGVAVMYTHNVTMLKNVFEDNQGTSSFGLLIKELQYARIQGNIFRRNTVGLMIDGGQDLLVKRNEIRDCGWGVRLVSGSSNDTIVRNNFIGNTFDMATNKSYNGNVVESNYWDKYDGYDIDHNGIGDVPYRPLSLFVALAEQNTDALLFFRSFLMNLLEQTEKIIPTVTPDTYQDHSPRLRCWAI